MCSPSSRGAFTYSINIPGRRSERDRQVFEIHPHVGARVARTTVPCRRVDLFRASLLAFFQGRVIVARIRTVKPELAAHEGLFDLERETGLPIRFAWCMLFTVADREGRFAWRPRTLKAQVLPHDEIDFSRVLDAWLTRGYIRKYRVKDDWFGWIPTFQKHQVINNKESKSAIPSIDDADEVYQPRDACKTRELRVVHASPTRDPDASLTREVNSQGEGRKERNEEKESEASQGEEGGSSN